MAFYVLTAVVKMFYLLGYSSSYSVEANRCFGGMYHSSLHMISI
jgi:hypothetical protein